MPWYLWAACAAVGIGVALLVQYSALKHVPDPGRADVDGALAVASDCAMFDGEHHKMWVIDQMVRHLTGCPVETVHNVDPYGETYSYDVLGESEAYRQFIGGGDWETGVAP